MKNTLFGLLISCFFLSPAFAAAQGIDFFHGTWEEALEKAKTEGKLIFVDAYASWCGPCKRMSSQIFPDAKAGEYYNAMFVNMKIDMEKPENEAFARKYPVGSFPTLMFIDASGKVVHKEVGARDVPGLIELGKKALLRDTKAVDFEKMYNDGNREPQFLLDYITVLNRTGKPSLKITNEYLNAQKDLTTPFNSKFLLEGTVEADSRVFDLLLKNKNTVIAHAGEEAFNRRVEAACKNTVKKAVEYRSEALLEEAKAKMKQANPSRSAAFAAEAEMKYFGEVNEPGSYLKAAQTYQKTVVKNNTAQLHNLAASLMRTFPKEGKILKQAEKWALEAAENSDQFEPYLTLAEVYKLQGDNKKAREAAMKAKNMIGDKDPNNSLRIDYFIQGLE